MGDKIELIKKIIEYHPASEAGLSRKWSHYTGGMTDTGDWYFRELLEASIEELSMCLEELKQGWKPRPQPIYTEEEKKQQSNVIFLSSDIWITEFGKNAIEKFGRDIENSLFYTKK